MRKKQGFPLVNDQGYIRIDTVNTLTFENLKNWIKAVLAGKDPCVGGERDDLPYGFLAWVYHQLNPYVREAFEDAILFHLEDLIKKPRTTEKYEYADELLLLVGKIFRNSHRSGVPVDLLLHMTEMEYFQNDKIPNLHWRVLQTLASIKYKGNPEFWINQYKIYGEEYASITITGLSLSSISKSIDFVKKEIKKSTVFKALITKIPFWVEKYGAEKVEHILTIKDVVSLISQPQREELRSLGKLLGIDFVKHKSTIFDKWKKQELIDFIKVINHNQTIEPSTNLERRQIIEDHLRDIAISKKELQDKNTDNEIIVGIKQTIINKRITIPCYYREKILVCMDRIIEATSYPDKETITESFLIIKDSCDIKKEFNDALQNSKYPNSC